MATDSENFQPYKHDEKTLAREWAIPGMKGFEHRVGGLEKANITGNVNYDPDNHHYMVEHRQKKVDIIASHIPEVEPFGDNVGDVLVLGWGGTFGALRSAVEKAQNKGYSVSHLHLRHINPFPSNLGELLVGFKKVLVPELNLGQLDMLIRAQFLIETKGYNVVAGKPFSSNEILTEIEKLI
jgi:2-oxoglutarate ferredoxin oxidoreductase subunit alpha